MSRRIVLLLAVAAVALVAADLAVEHHPHFGWEGSPGGYGVFGLLAAALLVLAGGALGRLLRRGDDPYGDDACCGDDESGGAGHG